jgi:hypothetical protein
MAFSKFISLLALPFSSLDYNIFNIGIYLDVKLGRIDPMKRDDLSSAYQQAKTVKDIEHFLPLLLSVEKEADEGRILYY